MKVIKLVLGVVILGFILLVGCFSNVKIDQLFFDVQILNVKVDQLSNDVNVMCFDVQVVKDDVVCVNQCLDNMVIKYCK